MCATFDPMQCHDFRYLGLVCVQAAGVLPGSGGEHFAILGDESSEDEDDGNSEAGSEEEDDDDDDDES